MRWAEGEGQTDLELGVALVKKHINGFDLGNIAVLLEFLADLRADSGYGHAQRVHGLDLRGLCFDIKLAWSVRYQNEYERRRRGQKFGLTLLTPQVKANHASREWDRLVLG